MSQHKVNVIKIEKIEKHENADTLDIITIGEYQCIVKRDSLKLGDLAVFIEPDYVVPIDRPEFSFLDNGRIKTKRLRGIWSYGLLIQALPGMKEGQNVMAELGIIRYDPDANKPFWKISGGEDRVSAPKDAIIPIYDMENIKNYPDVFNTEDIVLVTEKIHGTHARFLYWNNEMFVGSRTTWKKDSDTCLWWKVFHANSWIEDFCKANSGMMLCAEIFGWVQDLRYGARMGEYFVRWFDILNVTNGKFLSYFDAKKCAGSFIESYYVPVLYIEHFDKNTIESFVSGKSHIPNNSCIREGIVIKTVNEMFDSILGGRRILKWVSPEYLSR